MKERRMGMRRSYSFLGRGKEGEGISERRCTGEFERSGASRVTVSEQGLCTNMAIEREIRSTEWIER